MEAITKFQLDNSKKDETLELLRMFEIEANEEDEGDFWTTLTFHSISDGTIRRIEQLIDSIE